MPKADQPFLLLEQITRDNFSEVHPLVGQSKMATVLPAQKALSNRNQNRGSKEKLSLRHD